MISLLWFVGVRCPGSRLGLPGSADGPASFFTSSSRGGGGEATKWTSLEGGVSQGLSEHLPAFSVRNPSRLVPLHFTDEEKR